MRHLLVLMGALAVGCSNGEDHEGHTPDRADLASIEGKKFDELTHDQRALFMEVKVLPVLGPMFHEFDPVRFAKVNCNTCHGSNPEANHFEMPGDIKPLDFKNLPKDPIVGFMASQVKPKMAAILDQEPFNPATGTGEFGCTSC